MADTAHGTLTPGAVTQSLIESGRGGIVVVNRTMTGAIWVRIDGIDPVPAAEDTYAVPGAREFPLARRQQETAIDVRMISDEALDYSVEAY